MKENSVFIGIIIIILLLMLVAFCLATAVKKGYSSEESIHSPKKLEIITVKPVILPLV